MIIYATSPNTAYTLLANALALLDIVFGNVVYARTGYARFRI